MLAPAVRLMNEYKPLLLKLHEDATVRKPKKIAVKCYNGLTDVQIILGLSCIIPILRLTNQLMKYGQRNDVFVCDYLASVKRLQRDLSQIYIEEKTRFSQEAFWDFNALVGQTHDVIPMKWCTEEEVDLNTSGAEFLTFQCKEHTIRATFRDPVTKAPMVVTRNLFAAIVETVKAQSSCKS
jgi:hypothetical protein